MLVRRRSISQTIVLVAVLLALLFVVDTTSGPAALHHGTTAAQAPHRTFLFPLKVSRNRRYLVDQRGKPFLVVGDSPQALIGDLSLKDAGSYLADRETAGFNAIWVNLLCTTYTGCRRDGATYDGIKPFLTPGDLSTPNPAYFKRADAMIRLAGRHHIVVFLDPIETGGWLDVLRRNGIAKDRAFGRFLGQRYRRFGNVVWWNGNDFQTWRDRSDDAAVLAVARGIRSTDPRHLQTLELNYSDSGSLDDTRWRSIIGFLSNWQAHLDTAGSDQFGYLARLLEQLPWFRLAPDFRHRVVTSGYGTYDGKSNVASNNYVAAAATPNRKLALAYLPAGGTVSVDLARFAGGVLVRWFDPTNGRFRLAPGSRRRNTGIARLTAPGTNSLGEPDWLLVLTSG